ncbi:MAG: glycosyltransferase [Puniceicoccales bacterium]|jgi:cellulose synthase/poly-beta-1,6-N-acetylglucosamine synthase-like glycosyltransferase|nr:glycosyltransferase [Puniceicoccales bacterium]
MGIFLHKPSNYKAYNFDDEQREWPLYTVLLPLYKEKKETIANLLSSMENLSYPKSKIDLKVLVHEGDEETIAAVNFLKNMHMPFEIIEVPRGDVRSKPNSCNFGLAKAKGRYLTIYDAEDMPEKYQLKKAVRAFETLPGEYVSLQASLNFYNRRENFLTKCFAVEYSMWYDFTLRAISKLKLFFPLGGNSNHFKTKFLKEWHGWDAYNVTEDADLGVVIGRGGYKMAFLESITEEEAPTTLKAWIKQRTRWMKGFMLTFCGHFASPRELCKNLGFGNFTIFFVFVFFSFLSFLSLPFLCVLALALYLRGDNSCHDFLFSGRLAVPFALLTVTYWIIAIRNRFQGLFLTSFLFPFYWIFHPIASFLAFLELISRPFYWDKTEHGLSNFVKNCTRR